MLRDKLSMRAHMFLILMTVIASGMLFNRLLLACGLTSMPIRYPVAVLAAYGIFFGEVRLWLNYVLKRHHPDRHVRAALADAPEDSAATDPSATPAQDLADELGTALNDIASPALDAGGTADADSDAGGAVIVVLVGVVVMAVFGSSLYLIWEAPTILAEAAFQAALAASLRRRGQLLTSKDWHDSLLSSTIWPAFGVMVIAGAVGFLAVQYCPGASRLADLRSPQCAAQHSDKTDYEWIWRKNDKTMGVVR